MKKLSVLISLIALTIGLSAQTEKTALLLIDIQDFYFPGGFSELVEPETAASKAAMVLEEFRKSGQEIVHIQHKTDQQMDIDKSVEPNEGETIFVKTEVNAFNKTGLKAHLDSLKINNVVIVGMQTHMCVEAATRAAYDFGYKVTLVADACATKDLVWEVQTIKAADVHASTLNTLKNYATIVTVEQYLTGK